MLWKISTLSNCKLVQAMAFMSICGILKSLKSQGQILWKLSSLHRVRALSLLTESVVFSPASLGFGCLCRGQCCCGAAVPGLVPCWSWPCLPDLTSDLPCHYRCVWWSQSCWPTLFTITRSAVCLAGMLWRCMASRWGCCPACLAVTPSFWLPVPCRAASSHYFLTHKLNLTQFCCLVFIILY